MTHIVVVGPGGIGGTVAALLARTDLCRITLLGRPGAHVEAITRSGLKLTGAEEFTVDVEVVDDPAAISTCDGLLYAVKAQDTASVLKATAHIDAQHFVASLQNGVNKDDALATTFGWERVVGSVAIVAGERPEPGVVHLTFDGLTRFGELDGSSSQRIDDLVALFTAAGLNTESSDRITASTWSKMLGWIPIGLFATLGRRTNAEIMSDRVIARSYVDMVRELAELARSRNVEPLDLGPFHIASWVEGTIDNAIDKVLASPLATSESRHSAFSDIAAGRPTELCAILDPMLADADERDLELPAIRAMYAALMALEATL
tara:strand:- start:2941 stop:3897 length:957 start_codon:yes stop_codon:yes gene_type:complete